MAHSDTIDQIAERVDHLLLRHEELQRTNALLAQQVQVLTLERDQLKSRHVRADSMRGMLHDCTHSLISMIARSRSMA